jgi:hypothetical protein
LEFKGSHQGKVTSGVQLHHKNVHVHNS